MSTLNNKYPHLLPQDITVWERFLALHGHKYSHFDYDVRVGEGRPADPSLPANIQQMALDLSRRRIDAVGFLRTGIHVIEVTTAADLKAVGQLVAYPVLYVQTYPTERTVTPVLVCQTFHADIAQVIDTMEVIVYTV